MDRKQRAKHFIVLLGFVSLFADLCYEGMRSALGPYLAYLGASATAVGLVSGTGEMVGYALRYWSGALADRTQAYWGITIAGYATNIIAVPLLALAGNWPMVAALVTVERLGKAIRSPAKTTLTSFAGTDLGAGKAFAINEAMDQLGGLLGPLVVAGVLAWRGETSEGFALAFLLLGIPAIASVAILLRARRLYPDPRALEDESAHAPTGSVLGPRYRLYLVGVALIAIGLADWPLIAYHFERADVVSAQWLPVVYAAAMGMDGLVALAAGLTFDRRRARGTTGAGVLALFVLVGAAYGLFAFAATAQTPWFAVAGVALWSITHAATGSIAKAMIAAIVPRDQRGRAYGLFFLVFGVAWWVGSLMLGALYDREPSAAGIAAAVALVLGAGAVMSSGLRVGKSSQPSAQ
jgi:MFS family permease